MVELTNYFKILPTELYTKISLYLFDSSSATSAFSQTDKRASQQIKQLKESINKQILEEQNGHISHILFHPNNKIFITASYNDKDEYIIRCWHMNEYYNDIWEHFGGLIQSKKSIADISFTPDGKYLAIATGNEVIFCNINEKNGDYTYSHKLTNEDDEEINKICFSPNGKYFVIATTLRIYFYTMDTTKQYKYEYKLYPQYQTPEHTDTIQDISFPNNKTFVSSSADKLNIQTIVVDKNNNIRLISFLKELNINGYKIVFSQDKLYMAVASYDKNIYIWRVSDWEQIIKISGNMNDIKSIAFNTNNTIIASCSYDKIIRLWRIEDGKLLAKLQGHTDIVSCIAFSFDNNTLISGSTDSIIHIWNLKPFYEIFDIHSSTIIGGKIKKPIKNISKRK